MTHLHWKQRKACRLSRGLRLCDVHACKATHNAVPFCISAAELCLPLSLQRAGLSIPLRQKLQPNLCQQRSIPPGHAAQSDGRPSHETCRRDLQNSCQGSPTRTRLFWRTNFSCLMRGTKRSFHQWHSPQAGSLRPCTRPQRVQTASLLTVLLTGEANAAHDSRHRQYAQQAALQGSQPLGRCAVGWTWNSR